MRGSGEWLGVEIGDPVGRTMTGIRRTITFQPTNIHFDEITEERMDV